MNAASAGTACLGCRASALLDLNDFARHFIYNYYNTPQDTKVRQCPQCGLIQLSHCLPAGELRLQIARILYGAAHFTNFLGGYIRIQMREIIGKRMVNVFFENTGFFRLIKQTYELTANLVRIILVGAPRHTRDIIIHSLLLHFVHVLTGCKGGHTCPTSHTPHYLRFLQSGKRKRKEQITCRFRFDDISKTIDTLREGKARR